MGDRSKYEGGTLYCTRVPCFTCAKIIANSGITRVVLRVAPEDIDREPDRSIAMLEDSGLLVVRWLA
jgi:deoxycytidylate deaminase